MVNAYTTGRQTNARLTGDADGSFVVVWQSSEDVNRGRARWFDSDGSPRTDDRLLDAASLNPQSIPTVASNGDRVLTAWSEMDSDGDGNGVRMRFWDADGNALGPASTVNSYTTGSQGTPRVAATDLGTFVVTWNSAGQDGDGSGIFDQHFSPIGEPIGSEFAVNSQTQGNQGSKDLAVGGPTFVVVWENRDGDETIRGRRFEWIPALFRDGFESGDTSAWSTTNP